MVISLAPNSKFKKAFPVLLGNALEAYDFCLYGLLAPVFAKVFFPENFKYSLMITFALFATAYLSRPFGSMLWGYVADKHGRKPVLIGTLSLMLTSAFGMSLVPTYQSIGVYSVIIILILRLIQGIAFGGEFPTVMVTMYEISPKNKKGFFTSLTSAVTYFGHLIGLALILIISNLMSENDFSNFGWRILFIISIIFVFAVAYIRKGLVETLQIKKGVNPILETIKGWRNVLLIIFYLCASCVASFSYVYHTNTVIARVQNLFNIQSFFIHGMMIAYLVFLIPVMAKLGDILDRIKLVKIFHLLLSIFVFPIYFLIAHENILIVFLGIFFLGFIVATMVSNCFAIMIEISKKNCRVSMIGVANGIAIILFGATAPVINEFIINYFENNIAPSLYISLCALISLTTLILIKNKNTTQT